MNKLGKRYACDACGTVVLCLRAGTDAFRCCEQPMAEVEMRELPSGD